MRRRALVTGVAGQDGSYLAEQLLDDGYEVVGLVRPTTDLDRIAHLPARGLTLVEGDLTEHASLLRAVRDARPHEVYNLGAQTFVPRSFERPLETFATNASGVWNLLEAVHRLAPRARVFQAATSEMFGRPSSAPQNEATEFAPRSPYGLAKLTAHYAVRHFREERGLFCVSGIHFNHESPRRGVSFVTQKVATAAARIVLGLQETIALGNLDAQRDWGHAADHVRAMRAMLAAEEARDYVVATGRATSVRELCAAAFGRVGLDWSAHVVVDPKLVRPAEHPPLVGDSARARAELGWSPRYDFEALVAEMTDAALAREESGAGASAERRDDTSG